MIEDGRDLGLMLAIKHLPQRLEAKGMMSYPETQRMLDEALGEVKRLSMDNALTPQAATEAVNLIGGLYRRE
jgi:hypothetical protein